MLFSIVTSSSHCKHRISLFVFFSIATSGSHCKQISRCIEFVCLVFFSIATSGSHCTQSSRYIDFFFFRSSLPVHTVNRFHGTSNFFVCLVTIKTDINLYKTCTYYKIVFRCPQFLKIECQIILKFMRT